METFGKTGVIQGFMGRIPVEREIIDLGLATKKVAGYPPSRTW